MDRTIISALLREIPNVQKQYATSHSRTCIAYIPAARKTNANLNKNWCANILEARRSNK